MSIKWTTCQHIEFKGDGDPNIPQRYMIFDTDPPTVEKDHNWLLVCGLCLDVITAHVLREIAETMTVVKMDAVQIGEVEKIAYN